MCVHAHVHAAEGSPQSGLTLRKRPSLRFALTYSGTQRGRETWLPVVLESVNLRLPWLCCEERADLCKVLVHLLLRRLTPSPFGVAIGGAETHAAPTKPLCCRGLQAVRWFAPGHWCVLFSLALSFFFSFFLISWRCLRRTWAVGRFCWCSACSCVHSSVADSRRVGLSN